MKKDSSFFRAVCALASPAALQSMLQSSFSIVDQLMIGQLGSVSIAGVGLAGKFVSLFSVVVSAVGTVAGIMLSQYLGQNNACEVRRSFGVNLLLAGAVGAAFTVLCTLWPHTVMGLYTTDEAARQAAAEYLRIVSASLLPMAGSTLLATLLRCLQKPRLPLYASIASAIVNTVLNALFIFGGLGIAPMGAPGAAVATVTAQWVNFGLMLCMLPRQKAGAADGAADAPFGWGQYLHMLLPILICEGMWSVGDNVYAAIFGRMGIEASAAMTLTNPVQGLVIGALCGLSQAASILVGRHLGQQDFEEAYRDSRWLIRYGAVGALLLSVLVVAFSPLYVRIYQVEGSVRQLSRQLLIVYAIISPFKVLNMILGGGIIRSGGQTHYTMWIDLSGTWLLGVPLGMVTAFVLEWSAPAVYLALSMEEVLRFGITVCVFRKKRWMRVLG